MVSPAGASSTGPPGQGREGTDWIRGAGDESDRAGAAGVEQAERGGLRVVEVGAASDRQTAPVVGADIVEHRAARDSGDITAILAAKLVRELAARITLNHEGESR